MRASDLTAEEQAAVRRALGYLRCRAGSWSALARVLRAAPQTIARAGTGRAEVSASVAFRVARVAAVPVGDAGRRVPAVRLHHGRPRGGAVVILLWWGLRGLGRLAWAIGDDLLVIVGLKWRDSMGRTWWHV